MAAGEGATSLETPRNWVVRGGDGCERPQHNVPAIAIVLALLIGFGGLLFIMGLAGVDAMRVLSQFRSGDREIRSRYLSENHLLNEIRRSICWPFVSSCSILCR